MELPRQLGTYILVIEVASPLTLRVGHLGERSLPASWYAYVGSARGPGGLAARVGRHLKPPGAKRPRWHIDALVAQAPIRQVGWVVSCQRLECLWAEQLLGLPKATAPIPRFGASDCRCVSHLVAFTDVQPLCEWIDRQGLITMPIDMT